MLVESEQIIPITRLQKELTKKVRELSDDGKALYILKNNNMEAVMLSFSEYEYLRELEDVIEQFEIKAEIDKRLSSYDRNDNISWETLREEI